ncbi:MAG: tail fiber domain-containing protein [Cetobacterium sp.]
MYNAQLQNVDQYTPYGSQTFTDIGTKDSPKWRSDITLSPEQQQLLNISQGQDIALANLGGQQIGRISDAVSTPFSFGGLKNNVSEGDVMAQQMRAEEALMSRMNPQFAQDEEALRTRLINQGIGQGSEAYSREMNTFNQGKNDARTQAILAGQQYGGTAQEQVLQRRQQEISDYMTQRNAPLNEYTAMTSGSQIQNPTFQSGLGNQGINSFDISGAMKDYYSNKAAVANNKNAATTSFLGSAAGAFLFSDKRLKEDIKEIGETNEGTAIYTYKYKGDDTTHMGVMAQELMKKNPDAVKRHESGFYMVDYNEVS